MEAIYFQAHYGDQVKNVELNHPHGSTVTYQILIDKGYYGVIYKTKDGWQCHLNNPSSLYSEDQRVLEGMLTDHDDWKETLAVCQMLRFDHTTEAWPACDKSPIHQWIKTKHF